ncbi:MAG: YceI family protein [Pseudomonadota bacterium]
MQIISSRSMSSAAIGFFVAGMTIFTPNKSVADPVMFELDPTHTTVAFWIDHIGYAKTLGWFTEVSGSFTYNADTQTISDVSAVVNPASIFTNDQRRDDHVRSADFLNVDRFSEITFVAAGGTPNTDSSGIVSGNLTILGQSKPVELQVTLNKDEAYPFGHGKRTLGLSATTRINRSDFGMTYGLGGLVGDEVTVMIEVEAIAEE